MSKTKRDEPQIISPVYRVTRFAKGWLEGELIDMRSGRQLNRTQTLKEIEAGTVEARTGDGRGVMTLGEVAGLFNAADHTDIYLAARRKLPAA
ncbi:MAG TPA: hypothetical protein VGJ20_31525 [Xanthobacteraceae bacterium]|jgi:hypothetical protein